MSKKKKEKEYIEVNESRAMVYLPDDAYEIYIEASFVIDGKIRNAYKTLSRSEIEKAFRDAEENYIEDDDRFVLTEKGKELLGLLGQIEEAFGLEEDLS